MARVKKGRLIDGVLLLDKPQGMSSNDVLQKAKRFFNAQKAGHTGALDPLATGMLPICFGEATKFSQFLLDSDKRYRVVAKLGVRTDTSDAEGQIISLKTVQITLAQIAAELVHFRGDILQVPTMFSALKYKGRPLYEYARQGITIEREARPITVYENRIIQLLDDELELEIHCSKGTYIRTIIDDLGERLGCGAHVMVLRRLAVANYPADKMVTLEHLNAHQQDFAYLDQLLLAADSPVENLSAITVSQQQGASLLLGQGIKLDVDCVTTVQLVRIYQEQTFIGIGELNSNKLLPKRLVCQDKEA